MADETKYASAFAVSNIGSIIPITLDTENGQYIAWTELIQNHCLLHNLQNHLLANVKELGNTDDEQLLWKRLDALVKQWIFGTISKDLLNTILKPKTTAAQAWSRLENIFCNHTLYLEKRFTRDEEWKLEQTSCNGSSFFASDQENVDSEKKIPNWPRLLLPHEKEKEEREKQRKLAESTYIVDATPEPKVGVDPDLLSCPICFYALRPPVFQCCNGHLVCVSCRNKIDNKCPSCSLPVESNRCIAIEKIIESVVTSCLYTHQGCTEKLVYHKILEHEKICKYTTISCPECEYIGVPTGLYEHCAEKHPNLCSPFTFNTTKYVYGVKEGSYKLLQERDEKTLFVLHRVADPLGSFVNVTCVSPSMSDMKFSFDITVRNGDKIVSETSPVEFVPECFDSPDKEKCLLVRNAFHELRFGFKLVVIELVIRKVS